MIPPLLRRVRQMLADGTSLRLFGTLPEELIREVQNEIVDTLECVAAFDSDIDHQRAFTYVAAYIRNLDLVES